jgi:hypothetical protein
MGGEDSETPRHAKVNQQDIARIEACENVFGPPPEAGDPAAGQAFGKARRKGETKAIPPQNNALNAPSFEYGLQTPHDGFDFRKFWHVTS